MKFTKCLSGILIVAVLLCFCPWLSLSDVKASPAPKLSEKNITIEKGASKKLSVKNKPSGSTIKWTSLNTSVASINKKGKVTGKLTGNTKIKCKVTCKDGKVYNLKCKVTVKPMEIKVEVKDRTFYRDNMKIAAKQFSPVNATKDSMLSGTYTVLSHGLGGNMTTTMGFAQMIAQSGGEALVFDFIGGGNYSQSDGKTTEMSVLTEAKDLEAVIADLKKSGDLSGKKLILAGGSQGGYVSAYVAAELNNMVDGLILLCPAFNIRDVVTLYMLKMGDNIPEEYELKGLRLGSVYWNDALSVDIYEKIKDYKKSVLIIHGTNDEIVPVAYAEKAAKTYENAKLTTVPGGTHDLSASAASFSFDILYYISLTKK